MVAEGIRSCGILRPVWGVNLHLHQIYISHVGDLDIMKTFDEYFDISHLFLVEV
jgi:hypothetical protein